VTFGSVAGAMEMAAGAYQAALEAVADLPVRVLLTVGHGANLDAFAGGSPNVRVEHWVSQHDVLARAAAVVCHGGPATNASWPRRRQASTNGTSGLKCPAPRVDAKAPASRQSRSRAGTPTTAEHRPYAYGASSLIAKGQTPKRQAPSATDDQHPSPIPTAARRCRPVGRDVAAAQALLLPDATQEPQRTTSSLLPWTSSERPRRGCARLSRLPRCGSEPETLSAARTSRLRSRGRAFWESRT